jgi:hypothetical protein
MLGAFANQESILRESYMILTIDSPSLSTSRGEALASSIFGGSDLINKGSWLFTSQHHYVADIAPTDFVAAYKLWIRGRPPDHLAACDRRHLYK